MGLYALLYFWKRDGKPGSAFDLFFPFVVSSRSPDRNFTWFLPLNFYWRSGAGDKAHSNLLLLPLLYRNKNPEGATTISLLGYGHSRGRNSNGSVAWLYWYGRRADGGGYDLLVPFFYNSRRATGSTLGSPLGYYSRDGENKRGAVLWLYWFGRQREQDAAGDSAQRKSYDVLFPIVWSFRSPESSTTVLPLFLHMRRPTYSFTTLFPLYWAGQDHAARVGLEGVVPAVLLAHRGRRPDVHLGDAAGRVPPGQRAPDAHPAAAAACTSTGAIARREIDFLVPFFLRHRDPQDGTATTLLLNFYRRSDPQGSTTTLFPLFWHFRDAASGATAHTLFPLYFRRSGPDETPDRRRRVPDVGLLPQLRERDGGWSAGAVPAGLLRLTARPGPRGAVPAVLALPQPAQRRPPWPSRSSSGWPTAHSTVAAIPPLLYFYGREGEGDRADRYHVQFPLFWRFTQRADRHQHHRDPAAVLAQRQRWRAGRRGCSRCCSPATGRTARTSCCSRCSGGCPTARPTATAPWC